LAWIGDAEKVNRRLLLAVTFAMMGFGLLCFEYVSIASIWLIVPFLFFYGIGYGGCVALRPSLLMEYFGVTSFGAILGFMIGMNILGTLLGPTLTGWVYDNFGNYRGVWFAFASFAILTLLFIMTIPTSKIQLES